MLNNILWFTIIQISSLFYITIYQQTHYNIKEYLIYIKRHLSLIMLNFIMFLIYLISNNIMFIISTLLYLIYYLYILYTLRIKLKYTKRIIRLILSNLIFNILLVKSNLYILYPVLIIINYYILNIIEEHINHRYHKKALNKLNDYNNDIIAITGSFGKTSTKYYMSQILNELNVFSTKKSYNTLNGISLQINNDSNLNLYDKLILEFGTSNKGEILKLTSTFKPNICILTSIGHMHLNSFKNIDNIIIEKISIFNNLKTNDLSIINIDNEYLNNIKLNTKAYIITYGKNGDFRYEIKYDEVYIYAYDNLILKFKQNNKDIIDISNILPSIILGFIYNLNIDKIIYNIDNLKRPLNRQNIYNINNSTIIDDSFNSNINGALKAINILNSYTNKSKCIITPGFVECDSIINELYINYANMINNTCDYAYIVKSYNSNILYDLIDIKKEYISNVNKALSIAINRFDVILIENDIPDIYK